MKRMAGIALLAAAALVQVTWAPRLEVLGAFPNLVLIAVVAAAWTAGPRAALVWACAGGLLLDLTSSGPIGPHALALMPGVYGIGFWARNLEQVNGLHVALAATATTLLYSLALVLADGMLGLFVPAPGVILQLAIAAAAYNAILAPFVFEVLRRLQVRSEPV